MRTLPVRAGRRVATALAAVTAALSCLLPARRAEAQRRRVAVVYVPVYDRVRPTYVERPLTTERRHIDLDAGLAYEYADYFKSFPTWGRALQGVGTHAEIRAGLADIVELSGGFGIRFNDDARALDTNRIARVNREWLPASREYCPQTSTRTVPCDPSQGNDWATNPYARLRVAFVNRAPFMIGIEGWHTLPIVRNTVFTFGVGLPIHFFAGPRVRFETGIFTQFVLDRRPDELAWQVPFRVNFQVTDRLWLGIRSGLETDYGYFRYNNDARRFYSPLGFQGGVRIVPRVDLTWSAVFPEFIHTAPYYDRNVFFDRFGLSFGLIARVL